MSDADSPEPPTTPDDAETGTLPDPTDFLIEQCSDHQIVLLGDQRNVAQHLEFITSALPRLHSAGITNLGWEFTNSRSQDLLDSLIGGDTWDDQACADLFVDLLGIGFGYQQYADVLQAAWEINQALTGDQQPFRVVALGMPSYVEDPELLEGRSAGELDLRNWWLGGHYRDVTAFHMANVLTSSVIRHGQRALVYADAARTTTRLVEWIDGQAAISLGNLLHNWMGVGVRRIVFHGAVGDTETLERVEALIEAAPENDATFGLDLRLSTLGNVGVTTVEGHTGQPEPYRLSEIADGYIFVTPRAGWRPTPLIESFVSARNFEEAERRYRALDPRDEPYSLAQLEAVRQDGFDNIETVWPQLSTPDTTEEDTAKRRWFRRS